ncbi:hypothetical protein BJ546DRAFT_837953 [Cryomyces antarcticus]
MDGYDKTPQGLETSYAREVEREKMDGASKEETNAARLAPEVDGYDKTPQGLETSYRRECEQQKESKTSAAERQAEQAAAQLAAEVDGYDKTPQGLETSYARDVARQRSGDLKLEQKAKDRALVSEIRTIYENHYGTIDTAHRQNTPTNEFEGLSQNAAESSTTPEPAQYKILAYDSGNDIITTATTTTNFPDTSENPISISDALSQLYQPARFIPHFATLQSEGYQVIYSARDLLIFKKKGEAAAATTSEASLETKPAPAVEPIKTITGNYASPTGFVNHDSFAVPAATSEQPMPYQYPSASVPNPRVRREERVFSGSRRRWHDRGSSSRRHERQQRRRFRDRLLWTLSVGTATAVCMYVFGVAAELVRGSAAADREWRSRAQIEEDVALSARRGNGGGQ